MKKLLIALAILAVLLVILYQVASYFVFQKLVYEECVNEYSNDETISLVVKDVNAVCECITTESRSFGLINTLLEEENSPKKQELSKKIEEKCVMPNITFEKLADKALQEAMSPSR